MSQADRRKELRAFAAFSTPLGRSAIAVCRVSGPDAAAAVDKLFSPLSKRYPAASKMQAYTTALGYWHFACENSAEEKDIIDQVVLAAFRAPNSFTGQDLYEISCHGNPFIKSEIMKSLIDVGVRPAEPGEFSKTAFLNGKLQLEEAEAVMDLIEASGKAAARQALLQLSGKYAELLNEIKEAIYAAGAALEVYLEFSEEDLGVMQNAEENAEEEKFKENLYSMLKQAEQKLEELLASAKRGRVIKEGIKVVITGPPNAGKSSLLNTLLAEDRAIVSNIPGTTRDTLSAYINIDGIICELIDTAGLRDSDDPIESEGVRRAVDAIKSADLLIEMISPDLKPSFAEAEEYEPEELQLPRIYLCAKQDLEEGRLFLEDLRKRYSEREIHPFIKNSSESAEDIKNLIKENTAEAFPSTESSDISITNQRHYTALSNARDRLKEARQSLDAGIGLDLTASVIRSALDNIAELTGENVGSQLAEIIFSGFCVGK